MFERGESQPTRLPAPVGGLNVRDNPRDVPITDALDLLNLVPEADSVVLRGGRTEYIGTGLGSGAVDTLAVLQRGSAEYLVAGTNSKFYNVSTATPADITGAATITVDRWDWVAFGDSDTYNVPELLFVNGTDAPLLWTGTGNVAAWTFYDDSAGAPAAFTTGPALVDFVGVIVFKNRVFLWPKDSRDFYFGKLGQKPGTAVADAVTRFPLSAVRGAQGNIIAMEAWTRDAGDGPDDYLAIITDAGNAIIYAGSDPGTASLWQIVGVFTIPPPVDGRAVTKILDDIAILTEQDVYFLSEVVRSQGLAGSESKIAGRVQSLVASYGTTTGWEFFVYPKLQRAYLNVPVTATTSRQLVVNTRTLAWTEYDGWNARTFQDYKGTLYFGDGAGNIWVGESGRDDDGSGILWRYSSSFLPLHVGWQQLQAIRPILGASESLEFGYTVSEDFQVSLAPAPGTVGDSTGWEWDSGEWATIRWNTLDNTTILQDWVLLEGGGQAVGISLAAETTDIAVRLYSVGLLWTPGGPW